MALYTPEDKERMIGFVGQLMNNSNLRSESMANREQHIIIFISQNEAQLRPTFSDPRFFPHLNWTDALKLLLTVLKDKVINDLQPRINTQLKALKFTVPGSVCTEGSSLTVELNKTHFETFLSKILSRREVRQPIDAALKLLEHNQFESYVSKAVERREYVYNELFKVEKLSCELSEVVNYFKLLLLLRCAAYIRLPISTNKKSTPKNLPDLQRFPAEIPIYHTLLKKIFNTELPELPESFITTIFDSFLPVENTPMEAASARFLRVMHTWGYDFRPGQKVDKGAETQAKSWFNIQRRNARSFGYDPKQLEEFYKIAADEGW